jgi:hypothetical protein
MQLASLRLPAEPKSGPLLVTLATSFAKWKELTAGNPALVRLQKGMRDEIFAFVLLQVHTLNVVGQPLKHRVIITAKVNRAAKARGLLNIFT